MTVAEAPPQLDVDVLHRINPQHLAPNPLNPRKDLGDLTEMAASIREQGVIEPLLCTPAGVVVAGHRRRQAAIDAQAEDVPVLVRNLTQAQQLEAMLTENLQRSDLTALEEAQAYQQLLDLGAAVEEISQHVGTREERIRKRTALLSLPNNARELLEAGAMTMAAAEELLKLRDHPEAMQRCLNNKLRNDASPIHPITHFWDVDRELDNLKVAAARAKAEEAAKAKGLKVVKLPSTYDRSAKHRQIGTGYGQLNVVAKDHARLKCHAVAIDTRGKLQPVCTKPADHAEASGDAASTSASRGPGRDYEAEREAQAARDRQRLAILAEALAGDPKPVYDLVTRIHIIDRDTDLMEIRDSDLCTVLGVPFDENAPYMAKAPTKAFLAWLVANDLQPIRISRATAAVTLLRVDSVLLDVGRASAAVLHYAAWLQEQGYEFPEKADDDYGVDQTTIAAFAARIAKDPLAAFMDPA